MTEKWIYVTRDKDGEIRHGVLIGNRYVEITSENAEADARLAAVAPEMFRILQCWLADNKGNTSEPNPGLWADMAERVIAKAMGVKS